MISIAAISLDIERLDPISVVVPRLANVIANEAAGLEDIVRVIEYDPALTANSIRLANSAYFSLPTPVQTVREAVQQIGAGRILQDAVGRAVGDKFKSSMPSYELEELEFWRHSVATATCAALLPRFAKISIPPMAFTAALLHDLGKLIIARHIDQETRRDIKHAVSEQFMTYVQAERFVLGFDHAQVGGLVARRWRFPEELTNCIIWHHHPRRNGIVNAALDAVHVSNAVAKTIGTGLGAEGMNMSVNTESVKALGLTLESLESLCAMTMIELPQTLELFEDVNSGIQHSHH